MENQAVENLNKAEIKKVININLQGGINPIVEAGNYQLIDNTNNSSNSIVIRVDTSVTKGTVNIALPLSTNYSDGTSPNIYIIDTGVSASVNPIIISVFSQELERNKDLINGASSIKLDTDGGNICVFCLTRNVYIANGTISSTLVPAQA